MKIVLLALDREPERAEKSLRALYPQAEIHVLPLAEIESSNAWQRLGVLRTLKPDIFAVATERLPWQQGQNVLLLFGALGGARRLLLFDAHGGRREETRSGVLIRGPVRLAREAWASRAAMRSARREMTRLEKAIKTADKEGFRAKGNQDAPNITYLRTTTAAGTQSGGAATHTIGFINAAVELGARLTIISNDRIAGLDEARIPVKLIYPDQFGLTRPAFDLRNGLLFTDQACAEIDRRRPDFIYQRYSRFNWTGVEAAQRAGVPLFLEYNGSEVWMAKHWGRLQFGDLLERCERLNLAAATRVFVVAEVERNNLIEAGVDPGKIVVNPNGVDTEKFRPGIGGKAVRRDLGVADDETLVGFVGTFGPWHGVQTLAEAITLLPEDRGIRFLFVGSGMFRDEVERMIRAAGKEQHVIFTGQVDHERVPALLDACDILLSPHVPLEDGSEFFGSPTKLFEYMAMGKGIVASRLGQIGDVLDENETALLVEPGNAKELSEAIQELANDRTLRSRLGEAARVAAVSKHTWQINARRVLDEYYGLLQ